MIVLALVLGLALLWAVGTFVTHHLRRKVFVWRIRLGGGPKDIETRHRFIRRSTGEWKGPGLRETMKRLAQEDGLRWLEFVDTVKDLYESGQWSRAKAVSVLKRLENESGGRLVALPDRVDMVERPRAPRVEHLRPDPGRRETR